MDFKTLWEKKKTFVTIITSFPTTFFYPFTDKLHNLTCDNIPTLAALSLHCTIMALFYDPSEEEILKTL